MPREGEYRLQPIEGYREEVIQALYQYVGTDTITLDEFERRVELAHRATSRGDLDSLIADLPPLPHPGPGGEGAPQRATRPPAQIERRESQVIGAVMGGATRKGPWVPAARSTLIAMMGGIELDFREATLPRGVTEVTAIAVMGGIEIIVPPDIVVDCDGLGIMGGFDHQSATPVIDPELPRLRIKGIALMGGVEVRVRLPGETAGDARRRMRAEMRAARREQRIAARASRRVDRR